MTLIRAIIKLGGEEKPASDDPKGSEERGATDE